nr:LOW QUALITY PROTEIN: nibrin-like [Procambarus clarkii]
MWTLESTLTNPEDIRYLYCGTPLMVSRQEGHVLLKGDKSISRQHAAIFITHSVENLKNPQALPKFELTELGAKYGTFVNEGIETDRKLAINSKTVLQDGDRLRFGMLTNTWRLAYRPLVVASSSMPPNSKALLTDTLLKLGGHMVGEWNHSCTYLVMTNITFTVKAVCALADRRYIVTPEFFAKWLDAVINKTSHPNPAEYEPPLKEVTVNSTEVSFAPDEKRKSLLSGQTFLFNSEKQLKRMGLAISLAGGSSEKLNEKNYKLLISGNHRLVKNVTQKSSANDNTLYNTAEKILNDNGLRAIPEADIGLAILYIDTSGHCNPAFKVSSILRRIGSSASQMTEGLKIYASETQDTEENALSLTGTRVVAETGQSSTSKRTPSTAPTTNPSLAPSNMSTFFNTSTAMLPTIDQSLTGITGSEGKDNILNSVKKRQRPQCDQETAPLPKRSNKLITDERHLGTPDPTQPMESQIDGIDSQSDSQLVSSFEPRNFSTQKNVNSTPITSSFCTPRYQNGTNGRTAVSRVLNNTTTTTTIESHDKLNDHAGVKSVPFVPYTLPSLTAETQNHHEVSTQSFAPVKEELPSVDANESLFDVTDCQRVKRRAGQEIGPIKNENNFPFHGGKKRRMGNDNSDFVKTERSSGDVGMSGHVEQRAKTPIHSVKQELANDEDLFSLPTSSARRRRRENCQSPAAASVTGISKSTREPVPDAELFALPASSRSERRRRQLEKMAEDTQVPPVSSRIESEKATTSLVNNPSEANVQQGQQNVIITNTSNFISKKDCSIKRSPSDLETAAKTGMPPPLTMKPGDVAELSGMLEKSLMVLEVVSLVRRNNRPVPTPSYNQSSDSLKNYKRFRKNISEMTSLPRIIGGRDLVAHDVAENPLRNAWFEENPDVTRMLDERTMQKNAGPDSNGDNELFDLPINSRNRSRIRR